MQPSGPTYHCCNTHDSELSCAHARDRAGLLFITVRPPAGRGFPIHVPGFPPISNKPGDLCLKPTVWFYVIFLFMYIQIPVFSRKCWPTNFTLSKVCKRYEALHYGSRSKVCRNNLSGVVIRKEEAVVFRNKFVFGFGNYQCFSSFLLSIESQYNVDYIGPQKCVHIS